MQDTPNRRRPQRRRKPSPTVSNASPIGYTDLTMPEPDYTGGDPPGIFNLIVGTILVFLLLIVIKSCVWGS
jgi:hypothetical protein